MISYQTLLNEIEQLVVNAKNGKDEHQLREQLSAIRALCNVALSNGSGNQASQVHNITPSQQTQVYQLNPSQSMMNNTSSLNGPKLQENDANGDSIFDF